MLLDEPTTTSRRDVQWLEQPSRAVRRHPCFAVTHDRYFLDKRRPSGSRARTAPRLSLRGKLLDVPRDKSSRIKVRRCQDAKRTARDQRELEWVRPTQARQAKSKRRLARFETRRGGGPDEADRLDVIQNPRRPAGSAQQVLRGPTRSGRASAACAHRRPVVLAPTAASSESGSERRSARPRCSRWLSEWSSPTPDRSSGGERRVLYVDQSRAASPEEDSLGVISDGLDYSRSARPDHSRAYVASFGFKVRTSKSPAGVLSGGERNRLNLALHAQGRGNVLLLDVAGPTISMSSAASSRTHSRFPGCAVVISHDRGSSTRSRTHLLAWRAPRTSRPVVLVRGWLQRLREHNKVERLGEGSRPPAPCYLPPPRRD